METVIILLLSHFIGDYALQNAIHVAKRVHKDDATLLHVNVIF